MRSFVIVRLCVVKPACFSTLTFLDPAHDCQVEVDQSFHEVRKQSLIRSYTSLIASRLTLHLPSTPNLLRLAVTFDVDGISFGSADTISMQMYIAKSLAICHVPSSGDLHRVQETSHTSMSAKIQNFNTLDLLGSIPIKSSPQLQRLLMLCYMGYTAYVLK